ncbi:hypothetical protein CHARACLAT_022687 [Characodon lateralis]|uniref:Uncharacterized protein n=1 Tax=Characodon lateralis TaxID=208331 RepID=A0ABU7ECN8_9TELE|nr:hypothetical protein [Characodon lateralis]
MDVIHSLTLPIHTLYSQVQVLKPHRGNQPPNPGGGPLSSGGETGRPPQHLTGPGLPGLVPEPERPQSPTNPILIWRGGHEQEESTWSKLAWHQKLPQNEIVPTPQ